MTNRQLLALAKQNTRMPRPSASDNSKAKAMAYALANPNAYKRAEAARAELARFGF
jgi:hypothetical protein